MYVQIYCSVVVCLISGSCVQWILVQFYLYRAVAALREAHSPMRRIFSLCFHGKYAVPNFWIPFFTVSPSTSILTTSRLLHRLSALMLRLYGMLRCEKMWETHPITVSSWNLTGSSSHSQYTPTLQIVSFCSTERQLKEFGCSKLIKESLSIR